MGLYTWAHIYTNMNSTSLTECLNTLIYCELHFSDSAFYTIEILSIYQS